MARGRHETGRARHAARARRADDPRRGRSATRSACAPTRAPRSRSRRRRSDLGKLTVAGAAEDRGRRQEHRREDPRADRDRQGREARGAAREAPARAWWRCCASRASARRRSSGCAPSWASQSIDDLRRVLAEHKLRDLKGFGAEVRGEAGPVAGAPRAAGVDRAHADLGGAAAGARGSSRAWRRCRA